jgi:hypothetical protein
MADPVNAASAARASANFFISIPRQGCKAPNPERRWSILIAGSAQNAVAG